MVLLLKDSILRPDPPQVRFGDLQTVKSLKKWFSFNAQDQEILNAICLTAPEFAACIQANMPDFINTRSTMARPISSTWISAEQEKAMRNLSNRGWKRRESYI